MKVTETDVQQRKNQHRDKKKKKKSLKSPGKQQTSETGDNSKIKHTSVLF